MKMPTFSEIGDLAMRADEARDNFCNALFARWPAGTEVRALLSHRQKNPTLGTVTGARGDGRLCVRLSTVNRRGNRTIKCVHWTKILPS